MPPAHYQQKLAICPMDYVKSKIAEVMSQNNAKESKKGETRVESSHFTPEPDQNSGPPLLQAQENVSSSYPSPSCSGQSVSPSLRSISPNIRRTPSGTPPTVSPGSDSSRFDRYLKVHSPRGEERAVIRSPEGRYSGHSPIPDSAHAQYAANKHLHSLGMRPGVPALSNPDNKSISPKPRFSVAQSTNQRHSYRRSCDENAVSECSRSRNQSPCRSSIESPQSDHMVIDESASVESSNVTTSNSVEADSHSSLGIFSSNHKSPQSAESAESTHNHIRSTHPEVSRFGSRHSPFSPSSSQGSQNSKLNQKETEEGIIITQRYESLSDDDSQ